MKRAYFTDQDVAVKFAAKVYDLGYNYITDYVNGGVKISWYPQTDADRGI